MCGAITFLMKERKVSLNSRNNLWNHTIKRKIKIILWTKKTIAAFIKNSFNNNWRIASNSPNKLPPTIPDLNSNELFYGVIRTNKTLYKFPSRFRSPQFNYFRTPYCFTLFATYRCCYIYSAVLQCSWRRNDQNFLHLYNTCYTKDKPIIICYDPIIFNQFCVSATCYFTSTYLFNLTLV